MLFGISRLVSCVVVVVVFVCLRCMMMVLYSML